jgi:branched-chain amino acid transport system ATP-binding protein
VQAGVLADAEQRALELGITVASGAEIILLDEPTAGMSRSDAEERADRPGIYVRPTRRAG